MKKPKPNTEPLFRSKPRNKKRKKDKIYKKIGFFVFYYHTDVNVIFITFL